jgi:hypothetical protein
MVQMNNPYYVPELGTYECRTLECEINVDD